MAIAGNSFSGQGYLPIYITLKKEIPSMTVIAIRQYPTTGTPAKVEITTSKLFPYGITPDPTNTSAWDAIGTSEVAKHLLTFLPESASGEKTGNYSFLTQLMVPLETVSPSFRGGKGSNELFFRTDHFVYVDVDNPEGNLLIISVKRRLIDEIDFTFKKKEKTHD